MNAAWDEFPAALECRLIKVNEDGNIIGQIVGKAFQNGGKLK